MMMMMMMWQTLIILNDSDVFIWNWFAFSITFFLGWDILITGWETGDIWHYLVMFALHHLRSVRNTSQKQEKLPAVQAMITCNHYVRKMLAIEKPSQIASVKVRSKGLAREVEGGVRIGAEERNWKTNGTPMQRDATQFPWISSLHAKHLVGVNIFYFLCVVFFLLVRRRKKVTTMRVTLCPSLRELLCCNTNGRHS